MLIFSFFSVQITALLAQTKQTKEEKKIQKIKEKINKLGVGEKVTIKVKLKNKTTYQGYLSEVNTDDFVVVDKVGGKNLIKYSEVDSIGGKNLSTGAAILIGVGISLVGIAIIGLLFATEDS